MNNLSHLANKLTAHATQSDTMLGLTDGLTGQCLFMYYLSGVYGNDTLKITAEHMLDKIYERIGMVDSMNLHYGLLGIGIGIDYLIRNRYVAGDSNTVLGDIDDALCRKLSDSTVGQNQEALTLIHALHYFCLRWKAQRQGCELQILYKEFIIYLLEELHKSLNVSAWEAPLLFSLDYPLPQLLYVYGEVYALGFYTQRLGVD